MDSQKDISFNFIVLFDFVPSISVESDCKVIWFVKVSMGKQLQWLARISN